VVGRTLCSTDVEACVDDRLRPTSPDEPQADGGSRIGGSKSSSECGSCTEAAGRRALPDADGVVLTSERDDVGSSRSVGGRVSSSQGPVAKVYAYTAAAAQARQSVKLSSG